MAGLDTRGLADGFLQGFSVMDRHQRGQAADRRADEQMALHRRNAEYQRKHGDRQFGLQQQQLEHNVSHADRQFGLQEQQFEHNVGQADRQFGLQQQRLGIEQSRHAAEQRRLDQKRQDEQDEQWISSAYALISEGQIEQLTPEHYAAFERKPWMSPAHLSRPEIGQAVAVGESVLDVNSPSDLNQPEALDALNVMFGPEINQGEGGSKRIVRALPAPTPEHMVFELEVTRPDGSTYLAPMTEGRGTEDDAAVKEVPVEGLVNHFAGYRMMNGVLTSRPDIVQTFQRFAERMGIESGVGREGAGTSQARLNSILDQYTKDQMSIITDGEIMTPEDREARMSELDAVYARNLGVSMDALGAAREYANSEGLSLTPQLLQAVQQEMYRSTMSRNGEADPEAGPASIEEQVIGQRESQAEDRAIRTRTREIDDALGQILERTSQQHSPVANLPGVGPGVPGVGGTAPSAEEVRAAIDEIESMRHEFTPRQEARALKIIDQLMSMQAQ